MKPEVLTIHDNAKARARWRVKIPLWLFLLLASWILIPEFYVLTLRLRFNFIEEYGAINARPQMERLRLETASLSENWRLEVFGSAGSKSYQYLQILTDDGRKLLDHWSTSSLISQPAVWIESSTNKPARFLTYQPWVMLAETPLGRARGGFFLWEFDGKRYVRRKIPLCPLTIWLRNPLPFQD